MEERESVVHHSRLPETQDVPCVLEDGSLYEDELRACEEQSLHEMYETDTLTALTTLKSFSSTGQFPSEFGMWRALTTLSLDNCRRLKQLPQEVGILTDLTTLSLQLCWRLELLPRAIGKMTSLTTLSLQGCRCLEHLPCEIGNLTALTTLSLDECQKLKHLPQEIGKLTALMTLNLAACKSLEQLPHEIGNLISLMTLRLDGCDLLKELPREIGNLTALTTLSLYYCESLEQLPHEIGNLTALETLFLNSCLHLEELPCEIGNLTSLVTLILDNCEGLKQLPWEIGNLTSLITLSLKHCLELTEVPSEIGKVTALTTLSLEGLSKLKQLPAEIGNLTALATLSLDYCSTLEQLPREIGRLTALIKLSLNYCSKLKQLPCEIGDLVALTTLNLRFCSSLEQLPWEIGNLMALVTLDLSRCESLALLPSAIGNLVGLTTLNMTSCYHLRELPHEIGNLRALTTLCINYCGRLKQLPSEIGSLMALITLSLEGLSQLRQLPSEIGNLEALMTLSLKSCSNLEELPREIGNLRALMKLSLDLCTKLKALPSEIGNITTLSELSLGYCSSLERLPSEIGNLSSLTTLELVDCKKLAELPHVIGNLTALTIRGRWGGACEWNTSNDSGNTGSGLKSDIADDKCSSSVIHGDSNVCASSSDPGPYSARIQSIQERFSKLDVHDVDARVEAEIDASRDYWTQLKRGTILPAPESESESESDSESAVARAAKNQLAWELGMAKVAEKNLEIFRGLQDLWPGVIYKTRDSVYFRNPDWDDEGFFKRLDDHDWVLSEKPFAEGGQGQLFYAQRTWPDGSRDEDTYVMKVFREGTDLEGLKACFPFNMLNDKQTRATGYFTGGNWCAWILGARMLKSNARFAFVMHRYWGDLRKLIDFKMLQNNNRGPPFTNDVAIRCMLDVARGMRDLHVRSIPHRDLKAANVLIGNHTKLRKEFDPILDSNFDMCRIADYECSVGVLGTGLWSAPERLVAIENEDYDTPFMLKSDVYSYGMTCYEILTGWKPFEIEKLKEDDYDSVLRGKRPALPGHLEQWIKDLLYCCWLRDPADRPSFEAIVKWFSAKPVFMKDT